MRLGQHAWAYGFFAQTDKLGCFFNLWMIFPKLKPAKRAARSSCYEPSGGNRRFATGVAVRQDAPAYPAEGHSVDGLQPVVGEQSPDEPGLEDEAHSRVEPLLPEAAPVDAVHSEVEAGSPVRSVDEACSAAEPRSLPDEAHLRSLDEARHCAVLECCAPQWRVEERCSLDVESAYWPLAELRHD